MVYLVKLSQWSQYIIIKNSHLIATSACMSVSRLCMMYRGRERGGERGRERRCGREREGRGREGWGVGEVGRDGECEK